MGLGLYGGGAAVARALQRRGAHVTITDLRTERELAPSLAELAQHAGMGPQLRFVLGEHRLPDFTGADLVVANPAVAPTAAPLQAAREAGVPVTSEIALFLASCPAPVLAVTGTQGKSSVCNSLAQLLEACGRPVHLGGNIGRPLIDCVETIAADDLVVLELSSYQLEALPPVDSWGEHRPRVAVACVTNLLSDHLERHGSRAAYHGAKRRLLELTSSESAVLVPGNDAELDTPTWRPTGVRRVEVSSDQTGRDPGLATGLTIRGEGDEAVFQLDDETLGRVSDLHLPGAFQRTNTLFALGAARLAGVPAAELARALPALRGLPHRLEDLGLIRGHRVWDNGISTTPDSTASVLGSLQPGFTLLLGGQDKGLSLDELARTAAKTSRRAITFGAARETLARALRAAGLETHATATLDEAVELAFATLGPGEELLFSPVCASFDAYPNVLARARAFRDAVRGMSAP
jgi:UDP-N-acetylmuramoylalanine--D-glutamate ligase